MKKPRSTLLVVDDETINIDILIEALGDEYTVRAATSGAAALDSVAKALPDLILMDVMMPDMDGFEVCRRLKDNPTTREVPVIFLTALNETTNKVKAFSIGGVDYVTKPFQFEEIHARVEAHMEIQRQKRELQQSYDKLRELESLRDSLVHMIIHDLRSPLSVVLGYLDLAASEQLPKQAAAYIGKATNSTETILAMVSTLLDINKMEDEQIKPDFSAVDLINLVSETIRMVEPLKGKRKISIASPEKIETLTCDSQLIRRVLQNLIGNAIKFTDKEKGIISVSIESAEQDMIRISVVDNGYGIPVEYHDKVFDKFWQAKAHKQGQMYSTGLGLTFCKLAVEAHGGRIELESEVSKGSSFWFELPIR